MMQNILELSVTLGFSVFLIGFAFIAPIVATIASFLAIMFWIPRIKREIRDNHGNSFWKYIKFIFNK